MSVVGIIAEYNPFHQGHQMLIQKVREMTGADACLVIMSSNYVQRGEPAVFDKYTRCRMALSCGADCVIELPVPFCTAPAPVFADAAVALLEKTGIVDFLAFGSECGQLRPLSECAAFLSEEPENFRLALQSQLKSGKTYPAAFASAAASAANDPAITEILSSPNNLLGTQYLASLKKRHSVMQPVTISRKGDYQSLSLPPIDLPDRSEVFASASAIRKKLSEGLSFSSPELFPFLPEKASALDPGYSAFFRDFDEMLICRLHYAAGQDMGRFADMTEDLVRRTEKLLDTYQSAESFIDRVKTRQITRAHVSRAMLHILLDLSQNDVQKWAQADYGNYIRVLGFRKAFLPYLSLMSKKVPVVSRPARDISRLDPLSAEILQKEIQSSSLYYAALRCRGLTVPANEYSQKLIVL